MDPQPLHLYTHQLEALAKAQQGRANSRLEELEKFPHGSKVSEQYCG